MADLPSTIRRVLVERCAAIPHHQVAVFLSAGVDSNAVMLAAMEAGKRVVAYSWMLSGRRSTDQASAQDNARRMGVPFRTVMLPTDAATIRALVEELAERYGCAGKTEFECGVPRLVALRQVEESAALTGDCADGYYGMSRKAVIAHSKETDAAGIDAFRAWYFGRPNPAQTTTIRRICDSLGKRVEFPWVDDRLLEAFRGRTWRDVNKPRQKEPTRLAFPELERLRVGVHVNLQLGDSGISDSFGVLVGPAERARGIKSPVAVYNEIVREVGRRA